MTENQDVGIKETKEAIEALKLGSVTVKHIVKGGVASIPTAIMSVAPKYKVFVDGFEGKELIKAELMNLEKAEIIELFVSVFDGVKEFEEAK